MRNFLLFLIFSATFSVGHAHSLAFTDKFSGIKAVSKSNIPLFIGAAGNLYGNGCDFAVSVQEDGEKISDSVISPFTLADKHYNLVIDRISCHGINLQMPTYKQRIHRPIRVGDTIFFKIKV